MRCKLRCNKSCFSLSFNLYKGLDKALKILYCFPVNLPTTLNIWNHGHLPPQSHTHNIFVSESLSFTASYTKRHGSGFIGLDRREVCAKYTQNWSHSILTSIRAHHLHMPYYRITCVIDALKTLNESFCHCLNFIVTYLGLQDSDSHL